MNTFVKRVPKCVVISYIFVIIFHLMRSNRECKTSTAGDEITLLHIVNLQPSPTPKATSRNTPSEKNQIAKSRPIVDLVITYVNGSDEEFQRKLNETKAKFSNDSLPSSQSRNRFEDRGDLRFLLRSVEKFGQLFRKIFLVVADEHQVPRWLNTTGDDRLSVVFHRDIWHDQSELPTFNSLAIEANLHRIKGLANLYVYCNDDLSFVAPVEAGDFFNVVTSRGRPYLMDFTARHSLMALPEKPLSRTHRDAHFLNPAVRSRDLILDERVCGKARVSTSSLIDRYLLHAPHPFIRSVMKRAESVSVVREALERTWRSRFRSGDEINVIHFFYTYASCGCGVAAREGSGEDALAFGIGQPIHSLEFGLEGRIGRLFSLAGAMFNEEKMSGIKYLCVNDDRTDSDASLMANRHANAFSRLLLSWQEMVFPNKSALEI